MHFFRVCAKAISFLEVFTFNGESVEELEIYECLHDGVDLAFILESGVKRSQVG